MSYNMSAGRQSNDFGHEQNLALGAPPSSGIMGDKKGKINGF